MTLRRRQVLKGAAAGSLLVTGATGPFIHTAKAQDAIKIASIVDLSGGLGNAQRAPAADSGTEGAVQSGDGAAKPEEAVTAADSGDSDDTT